MRVANLTWKELKKLGWFALDNYGIEPKPFQQKLEWLNIEKYENIMFVFQAGASSYNVVFKDGDDSPESIVQYLLNYNRDTKGSLSKCILEGDVIRTNKVGTVIGKGGSNIKAFSKIIGKKLLVESL